MAAEPIIPAPLDDDDDDVAWALQTAAVQWQRGQHSDAVVWIRRAVDAAIAAGNPKRTKDLNRLATDVADRVAKGNLDADAEKPEAQPKAVPPPRAAQHSLTSEIPFEVEGVGEDDEERSTIPPAAGADAREEVRAEDLFSGHPTGQSEALAAALSAEAPAPAASDETPGRVVLPFEVPTPGALPFEAKTREVLPFEAKTPAAALPFEAPAPAPQPEAPPREILPFEAPAAAPSPSPSVARSPSVAPSPSPSGAPSPVFEGSYEDPLGPELTPEEFEQQAGEEPAASSEPLPPTAVSAAEHGGDSLSEEEQDPDAPLPSFADELGDDFAAPPPVESGVEAGELTDLPEDELTQEEETEASDEEGEEEEQDTLESASPAPPSAPSEIAAGGDAGGAPGSEEEPTRVPSEPDAAGTPAAAGPASSPVAADSEASEEEESDEPAQVDNVLLESVLGLQDLPEDVQRELARSATLTSLGKDEEVGAFGAALVTRGRVGIMPSVADAAAGYAKPGDVVFTRGSLDDNIPLRVVAMEDGTVVASWTPEGLSAKLAAAPWVEDELKAVADRFQALAGATLGPLGDGLDDSLRALVLDRMDVKTFATSDVIVEVGKTVPGLFVVGSGRVELVEGDDVSDELGPGDFLFAAQVFSAGKANATARAGEGGALLLFASRTSAHELLLSVPPLIEILAG